MYNIISERSQRSHSSLCAQNALVEIFVVVNPVPLCSRYRPCCCYTITIPVSDSIWSAWLKSSFLLIWAVRFTEVFGGSTGTIKCFVIVIVDTRNPIRKYTQLWLCQTEAKYQRMRCQNSQLINNINIKNLFLILLILYPRISHIPSYWMKIDYFSKRLVNLDFTVFGA